VQLQPSADVQFQPSADVQFQPSADVQFQPSADVQFQPSADVQSKSSFFRNVALRHLIVGAWSFETARWSYFQGQQCLH